MSLIRYQWRRGVLPSSDVDLAKIARCTLTVWRRRVAPALLPHLEHRGDGLVEPTFEAAYERAMMISGKRHDAANARWHDGASQAAPQAASRRGARRDEAGLERRAGQEIDGVGDQMNAAGCAPPESEIVLVTAAPASTPLTAVVEVVMPAEPAAVVPKPALAPIDLSTPGAVTSELITTVREDAIPPAPSFQVAPPSVGVAPEAPRAVQGTLAMGPVPVRLPPSPPLDDRGLLFRGGLETLKRLTGLNDKPARSLLGRMLKQIGDDAAGLHSIIQNAERERPAEPVAWITGAIRYRLSPRVVASRPARGVFGMLMAERRAADQERERGPIIDAEPLDDAQSLDDASPSSDGIDRLFAGMLRHG